MAWSCAGREAWLAATFRDGIENALAHRFEFEPSLHNLRERRETAVHLACDNGLTNDSLLIVGRTGHVPPGNAGVATKVEAFVPGPGWVTLFDVPGSGFDKLTTDCTWFGPDGSEFRGEILLRGNLR